MEESKIPEFNKSQNNPTSRNAVDFFIGFACTIILILLTKVVFNYFPILTPFIILGLLIYFFKHRRWIFWGMVGALIVVLGVSIYFISQIKFG